ncbi:MAG TPA: hypothetical protein ENI51_01000 [Candidatus Atribacteria bacterium]|nr:hypothetical protein [Candidatus Atribacteria bacterium]
MTEKKKNGKIKNGFFFRELSAGFSPSPEGLNPDQALDEKVVSGNCLRQKSLSSLSQKMLVSFWDLLAASWRKAYLISCL